MGEEIKNLYKADVTCIANEFFEKYLADVNPDYLRVFLYITWKNSSNLTINQIADDLTLTENDVEKALKYWKKQKLALASKVSSSNSNNQSTSKKEEIQEDLSQKKEFKELLFYAEKMFPTTISLKQKEAFEYMINELSLNYEVVEYLIEYCCELDKTNARYMCAVADDWASRGIKTAKEAKKLVSEFEKNKNTKKTTKNKKNANFTERKTSLKGIEDKNAKNGIFG